MEFNSRFKGLNAKLNPICHLLSLLGAHPIVHVSRIRVKVNVASYVDTGGFLTRHSNGHIK